MAPLIDPLLAFRLSPSWAAVCSGGSHTRSQANTRPVIGGIPDDLAHHSPLAATNSQSFSSTVRLSLI